MPKETYERNYVAIWPFKDNITGEEFFMVGGFFANHKRAWDDDNTHKTRDIAQDHAEFIIKEFSMGGENNPIAIFQLDKDRNVMFKERLMFDRPSEWVTHEPKQKVNARL